MRVQTFHTRSEEETIVLGRRLAEELPRGVVLLTGNLGTGKTTLSKGIVAGMNAAAEDEVSSPTFTLIHDFGRVSHIDLYRLETEREVEGLGLDELIDRAELVLIEWGERFPALMPERRTEIRLRALNESEREITVTTFE